MASNLEFSESPTYARLLDRLTHAFNHISWEAHEQRLAGQLGWDVYHDVLAERQLSWLNALPDSERLVFAAEAFDLNSHLAFRVWYQLDEAIVTPEVVDAMHAVGYHQTAQVIQRANEWFGPVFPRNQRRRMERMGCWNDAEKRCANEVQHLQSSDPLAELAQEWNRIVRFEDEKLGPLEVVLARYAQTHSLA